MPDHDDELFRATLAAVAPGTELRDGLERILRGNTGALVVLGHDSCGAVTATRESVRSGEMPRGFQRSLVERIMPAVLDSQRAGRDSVDEIVEANVEMVAHRILDQSRSIASAVSMGRVAIVGMCYSLQHGRAKLTFGHGSWLDVSEHGGVEHQG